MLITTRNLEKYYGNLHVLKGISMEVAPAEIVSIVGASGAGKTTLLQILGTLDKPDSGTVEINNQPVPWSHTARLAAFRNKEIGFIFQFHHLLPEFTAIENVTIPAMIAGTPKQEYETRARDLLHMLNLRGRETHKPSELSGGEQQRVAVARALINSPSLVLADEPSGNLDSANAKELHALFFRLREELKQTFVIVTHNEELADMADRKLHMKDGRME